MWEGCNTEYFPEQHQRIQTKGHRFLCRGYSFPRSGTTQQTRLLKKTVDGLLLKTQNRTLKLWNMSRFCCLNWKYWASSLKVSIWSNFLARRKRRMKSSSVRRKPMSGLVTIMSRTFNGQTGSQTSQKTGLIKQTRYASIKGSRDTDHMT